MVISYQFILWHMEACEQRGAKYVAEEKMSAGGGMKEHFFHPVWQHRGNSSLTELLHL